jgi:Tfp pilus assembly protein PilF
MPMLQSSDNPARTVRAAVILIGAIVAAGAAMHAMPSETETSREAMVLSRSLSLIHEGHPDAARKLLEPFLDERQAWAEGHAVLALAYVEEERWETASKLFERALALDAELHEARVPYGWCLYYLGELERARASFETYLEHEPDYPDAVYALALIDFDQDDLASAERRLRRVIMLGRKRRDVARQALAHARLGDLYVRRGEPSRAKLELLRAIELDADNARSHFKLSHVLQLLGDTAEAAQARERYEALQGTSAEADER